MLNINFDGRTNLSEVEKSYIVDTTHQKGDAEINSMFDSRRFDEIAMGAVIVAMKRMGGFSNQEIDNVLYYMRRIVFGLFTGENLREACREFDADETDTKSYRSTFSEKKVEKMYDSGAFNHIIKGAVIVTLLGMKKEPREIAEALNELENTFGGYSANYLNLMATVYEGADFEEQG